MSFKILAIRPLEQNDTDAFKNLKPNYLYPFYNNYIYLNEENESIIANQQISEPKEYVPINLIECLYKTVNALHGDFINISAIVGKNGSGKSALLEFLYAYLYNISLDADLIKLEPKAKKENYYKKLHVEIVLEIDKMFYRITQEVDVENQKNFSNRIFKLSKGWEELTVESEIHEIKFKFYSIVLNYSIYGLNSEVLGDWINGIFHKNDGYQTPIVINPYRESGDIKINNEFFLAQSRLILHFYQIGKEDDIAEGIRIQSIDFTIDIEKHQLIKDPAFKEDIKTVNLLIDFIQGNPGITNSKIFSWIFNITNNADKSTKAQSLLKSYFKSVGHNYHLDSLSLTKNINDIKYLCFLYIFKKLRRISMNYGKYKIYSFLFDTNQSLSKTFKEDLRSDKYFNDLVNDMEFNQSKGIEAIRKYLQEKTSKFTQNLFGSVHPGFDLLPASAIQNELKKITGGLNLHLTPLSEISDSIINDITILLEGHLQGGIPEIFHNYTRELHRDNSHITFKLKQAINYFTNGTFEKISVDVVNGDNKVVINKAFFEHKDINNTPLAFFDPKIKMTKYGSKPFPFEHLSSGEQQLIHTILSLNYHIYNLLSITSSELITYNQINLIFDEIELYFHPEYQQKFVWLLINNLKKIEADNKGIHFNIIFSTHSPFILSDISSQSTLKLSKGLIVSNDSINSFGANIHDLLADEFFLEEGNIGAFAAEKIDIIYHKIKDAETDSVTMEDYQDLKDQINLIGEPVLRKPLLDFWETKLRSLIDKNSLIKYYEGQLKKLK